MTIHDGGPDRHSYRSTRTTELTRETKKREHIQDPVAVVSMGCRLPGNSNSPHALWKFLSEGGIAHNQAPESRFRLDGHHDGSKKPKTMRSPGGMYLEEIDPQTFDAQFFEIPRTEAIAMDPQQRQLLEVVYESLENAGITMETISGSSMGCFVGSYAVDYADMQARDPEDRAPSVTIGVGRAILSNRISHFLNIKGPSMTLDTACSGSLVAVDVACRYLQTGEIDGAVVAAANLYLSPEHNMDVGPMKGASSLSGKCHTFDVKADGYVKAEAVNAVILKRLDDAIRDGDPIRAVIRGTATNSDGRTPGIASPDSKAQATAIRAAYANAGISDLTQTTYLECHGTGTQAGDPTEVAGVSSVFADSRTPNQPLIIGSIKSNIGHSEPAAGISGLLKAILTLEHNIIPGNPTFVTPNPNIDFHTLKVHATRTAIPWPKAKIKRASVNSFGYGGSNAHVVLDAPESLVSNDTITNVSSYVAQEDGFFADDEVSARPYVLAFSANDDKSLQNYTKTMRSHLMNPAVSVKLRDLSYTLSERRTHRFQRAYAVLHKASLDESSLIFGKKSPEAPWIGFIFTGQGAQWSQMGRELVETFPAAAMLLKHLDDVLQTCSIPPTWSLRSELTESRSPGLLRQPEFSQPLCTALQLVILAVLEEWGISPQAVVGHSSGEIAAAYAAGYLTREDAIKAAYYRGQAAKVSSTIDDTSVGMLAAGLGPAQIMKYIHPHQSEVYIGCFNSPSSVTLSGKTSNLEEIKSELQKDSHFARFLQVDLAYHSRFMDEIGNEYANLLLRDFKPPTTKSGNTEMFSSVTGLKMQGIAGVSYWKANMVSPVRFEEAVTAMLSSSEAPDFLIEVGPSGALSAVVTQIAKAIPSQGTNLLYQPALSRGQNSIKSMFDVAGRLFLAGGEVDLRKVNSDETELSTSKPAVITDLPNYAWNHSTTYWYENESSKDWRYRMFPHHDLLGSKVLGTTWHAPSWKKSLRIQDLSWLKDHRMGDDIVFPAAGFMAMAIEAISQTSQALSILEGKPKPYQARHRLRDVTFPKALVLEDNSDDCKIMLSLNKVTGGSWHQFKVTSLVGDVWLENSRGLVRVEEEVESVAPETALAPLEHATPGHLWYKAMHDAGYNFGPLFQKHLEIESTSGSRQSRSIVSLTSPASEYPQSSYPLHPASIDGFLQSCAPSLWAGDRTSINAVLIPAIIDEVIVSSNKKISNEAVSVTASKYVAIGRQEETKNYMSNASVYDPSNGSLLFQISGLRYHKLDTQPNPYNAHAYSRVVWRPDVTHLSQQGLLSVTSEDLNRKSKIQEDPSIRTISEIVDLVLHKKPDAKIVEVNAVHGDLKSVWLDGSVSDNSIRAACREFHFASNDAKALLATQEKYGATVNTIYDMLDFTKSSENFEANGKEFDFAIVKLPNLPATTLLNIIKNTRSILTDTSHVLFLEQKSTCLDSDFGAVVVNAVELQVNKKTKIDRMSDMLARNGFFFTRSIPFDCSESLKIAYLSVAEAGAIGTLSKTQSVELVHLTTPSKASVDLILKLRDHGWQISEHDSCLDLPKNSTVLIADELSSPILPTIDGAQWRMLHDLIESGSKVLWLTSGSQLSVTNPSAAMINGFARTLRNEDPTLNFKILDVESSTGPATSVATNALLHSLARPAPKTQIENEFVERNGIIYVSRIEPDELVNQAEKDDMNGADPVSTALHDLQSTVRLRAERLGTLDSLRFAEVDSEELPLKDGRVEVELFAAGLNFKDVAITMGIVPENQYLLGLEGAGTIRRVGKTAANSYKIGDRVLVFEKGTFGNRIIATTERTYHIPDWMSYEEASTLPSVFLTALYSIHDLANTWKGDRVLIHSATGGLGLASIQILQYLGAEVFASVGNDEKRKFLSEKYGIPVDHIFNSRTTEFAPKLMALTNGEGVNVILNSLTEDILDSSWRCIADGGTMVELGKKDMLDRNSLSMEPFGRNASYRCFDMSHKHVSDALIARLLDQLMGLIHAGHLKPITPIKTFPFEEIPGAFHYMRGANHIGKIVISSSDRKDVVRVPVRAAPRKFQLPASKSIILAGGLKGLLGSLAIYLARNGAQHLVVLSRSGYGDARSQGVLKEIYAEGCNVDLVQGDVSSLEDVRRTFRSSSVPVGGIIQGAMVLRDKLFPDMTIEEYHGCISCKFQGTWNLHNVALEEQLSLDFFTMLSSISGVVGQMGQSNYAGANAFLDAFASYRQQMGLNACSVDLGAIEDVGYMSQHDDLMVALDHSAWTPINEHLFHKIVRFSVLQQIATINPASSSQLVTSLAVPQQANSKLLTDARFGALCFGDSQGGGASGAKDGSQEIKAFFLMLSSGADHAAVIAAAIEIVSKQFMTTLRLTDPMEPGKALSSYGLDSLSSIEFRNWVRMELEAELTTLEIINASSLIALCEKIVGKIPREG